MPIKYEYPMWLHHATEPARVFETVDEHIAAGSEWSHPAAEGEVNPAAVAVVEADEPKRSKKKAA